MVRVGRLELPASCSQSKRATNCATPGHEIFQLWSNMGSAPVFDQLPARGKTPLALASQRFPGFGGSAARTPASRTQITCATNCATPGYSVFLHDTTRGRKKQVSRVCGRRCGQARFFGSFSTGEFPPQSTVPRTSGVPLLGEWIGHLSSQITRAANYATFGHRYFSRPGAFFPTYVRQYTLRSAALALWHHLLLDRGQHDGFILYLSILPVSPPKSSLFASGRYVGKAVRRLWGLRTA